MKAEIEDRSGRRVGSVEGEGGRQVIRDEYGSRQGTVEENLFGERVIRDKNGEKVGTAFREFLGDEYNIYDKYGDRVGKTDSDILGKGVTIRDKYGSKRAVLLGAAAVVIAAAVCLCLALKGGGGVTDDVDRVKSPISTPKETADPYDDLVVGDEIIVRDADDTYANMREGPGTEYDVIRRVANGARAYLVEGVWDDAWTAVIYDGQMGWVRSYFIYGLRGVIRNYDNTGCNVRSGPGTDFDVIGYLYNGERVDAADVCDDHGWYCIDYGGREGWISGGFFHRLETVIYNAGNSGANFRSGPGLDYDVLAFIPNDTEVTPVDTLDEDEWVCVEYEGQFGWVNRQFVR